MLEIYGHGGDTATAEKLYGRPRDTFIDFSSNMNPWGPPQGAKEAMLAAWERIAAYPDPESRELRAALSRRHDVPIEAVWVGNGAAELIDLTMRSIRPASVTLLAPGFAEYEAAVRHAGAVPEFVPLDEENGFAPDAGRLLDSASRTDAVMVGNPNNPTGRLLPPSVVEALLRLDKPVVIDEAFLDFAPDEAVRSAACRAASKDGVYVIRSLTKFYSIPGLRLGYVVAHPNAIRRIRELAVPWSVNAIAQAVGAAIVTDRPFERLTLKWLAEERAWLIRQLTDIGLKTYPGEANYILFRFPPESGRRAGEAQAALGAQGILIRNASTFRGLDDTYCRVAVKKREDNDRLVEALRQWMNGG
ncbi:threonine-phosphate decarboxylase CobD [Paenibacillus thermotolerans]|uniref:threonine-phosphate decarboxylase CobD n=1 Tax=Paenibacillus thermotolerans TaxID=3027807 RepID=UPI0023687465|nr:MULTISPECIES: threonine-phosphate decarboxylase CobD [unclassified Paenibacillus]